MLAALGRATGGRQYKLLRQGLERLRGTQITTTMEPDGRAGHRGSFTLIENLQAAPDGSLEITLPSWITAAISTKRLLKLNPDYFRLTSGYERFLYRTARKHAGGHGAEGWCCTLPVLFAKSGSTGTPARFKHEIAQIIARNRLPDFNLEWLQEGRTIPAIQMTRRDQSIVGMP
jgi:plasmid replication initiation protein